MLFEKNMGSRLSIDEVSLTKGELYTVITNKSAHGKQGALVAMIEGTKVEDVLKVLNQINDLKRMCVTEATLDMTQNMEAIVREAFPFARVTTDRFHVQQLITEAIQEVRMTYRRKAIKDENRAIKRAKKNGTKYKAKVYENGDTKKQLLAMSRYLLFKPRSKWTEKQEARANILFREFPKIEHSYNISMSFRNIYETSKTIDEAKGRLEKWYKKNRR